MSSVAPIRELIFALMRDNPHELLVTCREKLSWAVSRLGEQPYQDTLVCALAYDKKYGRCPDGFDSLESFIITNPDNEKGLVHAEATVIPELKELREMKIPIPTDVEMLIRNTFDAGRVEYYARTYQGAAQIAIGSQTWPKNSDISGIEAARTYVREREQRDYTLNGKIMDGPWTKHTEDISKMLDDSLENSDKNRIYTGFRHIDDHVVIGPKHQRWIGILGYTNHGKSAVLLAMVYNMARAGHRVLLVPREASADETWLRLTFMHSIFVKHGDMGSLDQWILRPKTVTAEQRAAKDVVLKDLQERLSIKGEIDVKKFSRWEEITDHLEANKVKHNHDVLAVDYLGHLEVEGRDPIEAKKQLFRKAQMLSQDYNNGEGLVVITPLQANKTGMEAADKQEGDNHGCYTSLAAVDWYTQAAQDMSLVLSVWHDSDLQAVGHFKLHCLKSKGRFFPTHLVQVDEKTRYIQDMVFTAAVPTDKAEPDAAAAWRERQAAASETVTIPDTEVM